MAQARQLDAQAPPDLNALADFGFDLADGEQPPLAGRSAGETLLALSDALAELGADPELRGYFALASSSYLFEDLESAQACAALERVLSLPQLGANLVNLLRVERARGLISRQQLVRALADLEASRAEVAESELVLAALAGEVLSAPADYVTLLSNAVYWYAALAECEISLGRPARADGALTSAGRLAELVGTFPLRWLVFDLRLRQALAMTAWEEVEPLVERARAAGLPSRLAAAEQAQLDLRLSIARHELRVRVDRTDATELPAIRAMALDESLPAARRSTAARFAAAYYAELGDAVRAREALELVGGPADSARRSSFEAAELDAIALRIAVAEQGAAPLQEALERLERSAQRFLDDWAQVAELSSAVAVLQFAQRERVLAELIRGALAVHGAEAGARRGLEWLHRAQLIGGLARGLGLDRASGTLERDLEWLVGPRRGLLVFHSGRDQSYAFLVDERALRCVRISGGQRLREAASALANAATRAVRAGASSDDAQVRAELGALGELIDAPALLEWFAGLDSATIVGDESVGHLPLALLETGSGGRLGARIALAHAPSIPVAAELARRADERDLTSFAAFRARLVGAPAGDAEVGLEPARLHAWAARLGGRAELRLGAEATAQALECVAGEQQLLQVVAHGRYDPRRECRAGFQLTRDASEDGAVWSERIERSALPRLAALAVCGASQRPVLLGDDGRTGLAASFLLAGSDCVLQTPIDLEVQAAVALFEQVSVLVGAGATPAQALRDARRGGRGRTPKLQDFLVHAWGAGHAPIVDARTAPASREGQDDASQVGSSNLARVCVAAVALLAALCIWRIARRRPA